MDIRNEEETSREKDLNFRYKDLTEEEKFIDNVMTEENKNDSDKKITEHKITKQDIINSVMEQVKKVKRDDKTQEPCNMDKWFSEYQKQPITINKERVQTYLENYEDLEKLIKFRENKLVSGEVKPESKTLEINNISNLDFLEKSSISKEEFFSKVDYKLREMKFYYRNLSLLLRNLKTYGFLVYQFIAFKYFLKLSEKDIQKLTPFKNLDYLDNLSINYLKNKLVEEARKECQD